MHDLLIVPANPPASVVYSTGAGPAAFSFMPVIGRRETTCSSKEKQPL